MHLLLISTYELGHQPLHLASPAASLRAAGHEVSVLDLAVEDLNLDAHAAVDAVAISVPMHTAMRLAVDVVDRVKETLGVPVALYGLYAGMASTSADAVLVGEYEQDLVRWANEQAPVGWERVEIGHTKFSVPERSGLPGLSEYAHLAVDAGHRVVGYVEASHGCRHRCRHCPIPVVYDGRFRVVGADVVAADIDAQVAAGAQHITFGDPDFFNAPPYSLEVLNDAHRRHPDLTFDVTIKVEHLIQYQDLLPVLADSGVLFVVSAFESVDDRTLDLLDKGHTAGDMAAAVALCREVGLDVHPSWMPFSPWTTVEDVLGIFRFLDRHDLLDVTDPVQLSIRLLIPRGSLMLELQEIAAAITEYDPVGLTYPWASDDPASDALQRRLAKIASHAADDRRSPLETIVEMWAVTADAAGVGAGEAQIPAGATSGRPRMTEPWFC